MLADFGVDTIGVNSDLKWAYEVIEDYRDTRGHNRSQYLKTRFSNCQPTWHSALPEIDWQMIWTLNIDDIIEQAYAQNPGPYQRELVPYNWNSSYSAPDRQSGKLQIIHLHGYAPTLEFSQANLVFSVIEYLRASAKLYSWHHIFGDEFQSQPFIIVGASLTDEYES